MSTKGESMVVEALAGTGKTTTLVAMAKARPRVSGVYIAFNKSIVREAERKFPKNTVCSTAHSLAAKAVGKPYWRRVNGARIKSAAIAEMMGIPGLSVATPLGRRWVSEAFFGGLLMRALRKFSISGDPYPTRFHVPMPRGAIEDPAMMMLYREFSAHLEPVLRKAWADIEDHNGRLPFDLNFMLKIWQLREPVIHRDVIYFDEAQDANGVMRAVVEAQTHAQRIWVGDTYQQINAWNGAINALAKVDVGGNRSFLTQSFRFGPQVAEVANVPLAELGAPHPIVGAGKAGRIGPDPWPDVRLSRTNACAVDNAMQLLDEGHRPHIVGGASDVVSFCRGAQDLQQGRRSTHPDLLMFDDWREVVEYVEHDELGGDLALEVGLIEKYGAELIIDVLDNQPDERDADRILSTVHKAKGREWESVQIAEDFPTEPGDDSAEELRLLYVAATRAMGQLDITWCQYLVDSLPHLAADPEPDTETATERLADGRGAGYPVLPALP